MHLPRHIRQQSAHWQRHHRPCISKQSCTSRPSGVLAATAALSMSPVARWHRQCSFFSTGDCVPLPQPGGPGNGCGVRFDCCNSTEASILHWSYVGRRGGGTAPISMSRFSGFSWQSSLRCTSARRSSTLTSLRSVRDAAMSSSHSCEYNARTRILCRQMECNFVFDSSLHACDPVLVRRLIRL